MVVAAEDLVEEFRQTANNVDDSFRARRRSPPSKPSSTKGCRFRIIITSIGFEASVREEEIAADEEVARGPDSLSTTGDFRSTKGDLRSTCSSRAMRLR